MTQLAIDIVSVCVLMGLGAWLETLGGKRDLLDQLFTPLPMGLSGLALAFMQGFPA